MKFDFLKKVTSAVLLQILGHGNHVALLMGFLVLLKQHNAILFGCAASTMHRRTVEGVGREDQKFSKAILLDTRSCGRYSYHVCFDGRKTSSRRVRAPVFSVHILHSVILTEHIPCPRCPGNAADKGITPEWEGKM